MLTWGLRRKPDLRITHFKTKMTEQGCTIAQYTTVLILWILKLMKQQLQVTCSWQNERGFSPRRL